jgi:voltage-gated potassium channel
MTGRFSSRLERSIARAVGRRRIFPYLAGMTFVLALGSGALVTLTDPKDFPHFGTAVWWAIVTLATVGYGDVVPHTAWGRVLGSVVIVLGVTFLAFLTATVTSFFVSAQQEERQAKEREHRKHQEENLAAALERLEERLTAIENKLEDRH